MVFKKGYTPWNKGMDKEEIKGHYKKERHKFEKGNQYAKGRHPKTEFKKGHHSYFKYKEDYKPWRYIDGKWDKRKRNPKEATMIWCKSNNIHRKPTNCLIHHIDQNPLNNSPENLQLMDKKFHNQLHYEYFKQSKMGDII